jgi:hypothetical protein
MCILASLFLSPWQRLINSSLLCNLGLLGVFAELPVVKHSNRDRKYHAGHDHVKSLTGRDGSSSCFSDLSLDRPRYERGRGKSSNVPKSTLRFKTQIGVTSATKVATFNSTYDICAIMIIEAQEFAVGVRSYYSACSRQEAVPLDEFYLSTAIDDENPLRKCRLLLNSSQIANVRQPTTNDYLVRM